MVAALRKWVESQGPGAISRLSRKTRIPYRTMHRYVQGEQEPRLDYALRIERETGVPLSLLTVSTPTDDATGTGEQ